MDEMAILENAAQLIEDGKVPTVGEDGTVSALGTAVTETQAEGDVTVETEETGVWQYTEPELLEGWRFSDWRQRHLMAMYETGVFDEKTWENRFRRNYDTVMCIVESGGFERPHEITDDIVENLEWWETEQLYTAIWVHYYNVVLLKKKTS